MSDAAEALVEAGARLDRASEMWHSMLQAAAAGGLIWLVDRILDDGGDIEDPWGDRTPLICACYAGRAEMAAHLLERGADINKRTKRQKVSALWAAAYSGSVATIEVLLSYKAKVDLSGGEGQPLHAAVIQEHIEAIETLLAHGAKIQAKNRQGSTPLHLAAFRQDATIAETLLKHGAVVNAADRKGDTPLHNAVNRQRVETARALVGAGARTDTTNRRGKTPLDLAWSPELKEVLSRR